MVGRGLSPARRQNGFTVVEAMVVVAIVIILVTVAAPGLSGMIVSQQLKNASFDLASTLTVARSEALTRNVGVTISPRDDDWARGWVVTDQRGTVLRDQSPYGRISVRGPTRVTFDGDGRPATATVSFAVTSESADVSVHRCIRLRLNGRPHVTRGACS
jgi:type IV fimbrial biogenesis protein FimT